MKRLFLLALVFAAGCIVTGTLNLAPLRSDPDEPLQVILPPPR